MRLIRSQETEQVVVPTPWGAHPKAPGFIGMIASAPGAHLAALSRCRWEHLQFLWPRGNSACRSFFTAAFLSKEA